jgi:lipid A disaccharide synthetase
MFYKASKFNYLIGNYLLNLDVVSLVNILFVKSGTKFSVNYQKELNFEKKYLVSEYIQDLDIDKIIQEMELVLKNKMYFENFQNNLNQFSYPRQLF